MSYFLKIKKYPSILRPPSIYDHGFRYWSVFFVILVVTCVFHFIYRYMQCVRLYIICTTYYSGLCNGKTTAPDRKKNSYHFPFYILQFTTLLNFDKPCHSDDADYLMQIQWHPAVYTGNLAIDLPVFQIWYVIFSEFELGSGKSNFQEYNLTLDKDKVYAKT